MARKFKDHISHEPIFHKTSIGRFPSKQKMNKHKRRSFKKYRGQGKWPDGIKELKNLIGSP